MESTRQQRTRSQIFQAAGRLLKTTPWDKIKTGQISEEAMVSRSGFYLYFSDKNALVDSYIDFVYNKVESIYAENSGGITDMDQALIKIITFLQDEDFFAGLLVDNSNAEIREMIHARIQDIALRNSVIYYRMFGVEFDYSAEDTDYYVEMMISAMISVLLRWFDRRKVETPEKIAGLIKNSLMFFMNLMLEEHHNSSNSD